MWFALPEQPVFGVAGFWQQTAKGTVFTIITCDPTGDDVGSSAMQAQQSIRERHEQPSFTAARDAPVVVNALQVSIL